VIETNGKNKNNFLALYKRVMSEETYSKEREERAEITQLWLLSEFIAEHDL
jgi:hypothetical protein